MGAEGEGQENVMSRILSQDTDCMEGKAALAADLPNQTLPCTPSLPYISALYIGNSIRR